MRLLAIETSCDETAISIVEAEGRLENPAFKVLAEVTVTQLDLHTAFGGVVPMLAKREHQRTLLPVLLQALNESKTASKVSQIDTALISKILEREADLFAHFESKKEAFPFPEIDAIAVTNGPGLEPALWVGVNFAKALAVLWNKPLVPVNHMEGHLFAALADKDFSISNFQFPVLGLLVSGGHTELVLAHDWQKFEILGKTRDDAVGEAFDKVARILGLPYPGGPAISKLAEQANDPRHAIHDPRFKLPRPMLHSHDLDFSFSGLKTAVLYLTKELGIVTDEQKVTIAKEFQDAAIEVLLKKTRDAIEQHNPKTVVIGGGVSANKLLREKAKELISTHFPEITLSIPPFKLSTDNATMIAVAGYIKYEAKGATVAELIKAEGNMSL